MNVTVFGATGAIGQHVVTALLERGDTVTAYVRNPPKVPPAWSDQVRVVVGETSDAQAIDSAVAGAETVLSALGPSMDRKATGLPLVEGTRLVVEAMQRHGVRRFIAMATPSIADPRDRRSFAPWIARTMASTFMRRAYDELLGMTEHVTGSDLDWTVVRFLAPKDGPATGAVRSGFYGTDKLGFAITRADIARYMVSQIDDPRYVRAAPGISS